MNRSMMLSVGVLVVLGAFVAISILSSEAPPAGTLQSGTSSTGQAEPTGSKDLNRSPAPTTSVGVSDPGTVEESDSKKTGRVERKPERLAPPPEIAPEWRAAIDLCRKRIDAGEVGPALRELGHKYLQSRDPAERSYWRGPLLDWADRYLLTASEKSGLYSLYVIKNADRLVKVAGYLKKEKKIQVDPIFIQEVNGIESPKRIHAGERIWVPNINPYIEVRLKEHRLDHYLGDCLLASYQAGVGKDGKTPEVEFTVSTKLENPDWIFKGRVIPYEHEENELGERWIGLLHPTRKGFGIHGTNDESTVGKAVSRGCIRLKNSDVIELFNRIPKGTRVEIKP